MRQMLDYLGENNAKKSPKKKVNTKNNKSYITANYRSNTCR